MAIVGIVVTVSRHPAIMLLLLCGRGLCLCLCLGLGLGLGMLMVSLMGMLLRVMPLLMMCPGRVGLRILMLVRKDVV